MMTNYEKRIWRCRYARRRSYYDLPYKFTIQVQTVGQLRGIVNWIRSYRGAGAGLYTMFVSGGRTSALEQLHYPILSLQDDNDTYVVIAAFSFSSSKVASLFKVFYI